MRWIARFVLVVVALLAMDRAAGTGSGPAGVGAAPLGQDAAHGGAIYVQYGCYECHGRAGQGAPLAGPRLAPNLGSYEAFARQVWEPRDQMPPYSREHVSAQDVADIYAYLQSLPPPPALEDVPLLNQ